jgi:hypothetical protein
MRIGLLCSEHLLSQKMIVPSPWSVGLIFIAVMLLHNICRAGTLDCLVWTIILSTLSNGSCFFSLKSCHFPESKISSKVPHITQTSKGANLSRWQLLGRLGAHWTLEGFSAPSFNGVLTCVGICGNAFNSPWQNNGHSEDSACLSSSSQSLWLSYWESGHHGIDFGRRILKFGEIKNSGSA